MNKMSEIHILIVDDDIMTLKALHKILTCINPDFVCHKALNAGEGLQILESSTKINVVISDNIMPGMNGVELLTVVQRMQPQIVRILLSGWIDNHVSTKIIKNGTAHHVLNKPLDIKELSDVLNTWCTDCSNDAMSPQ